MACDLTQGRKEPCKDVVGGIKKVYFTDFGDFGTVTSVNEEITDMSGTFEAFEYDLKGNSPFETTVNSSRENGTTFFEQTLNITLKKLSKEFHIPIVEDAAEALGSYFKNKHLGTYGKIGILSFNGNKTITTGGGGALMTNDKKLALKAMIL